MIHALKINPMDFKYVCEGIKTFEARIDDRAFKVGDFLALNEYDPPSAQSGEEPRIVAVNDCYTGKCVLVRITHIERSENYCKKGYAIIGFAPCHVTVTAMAGTPTLFARVSSV